MQPLFRYAGIITVIFAVCGPARAQAIAPAGAGVKIDKVVIDNGGVHTVKYYVTGGSPQLQAMVRRVEWAENELSVIEQLQLLKLDTVVNERRVAAFRTEQLTNPFYPPGFLPPCVAPGYGGDAASPLQRALGRQLAYEATPESALQLIGFLENVQTELDAELKALPPQEQKAVQDPMDALRPKLAALPGGDVPPPRPQPVVPGLRLQGGPPAPAPAGAKAAIEVEWHGSWYAAEVLRASGGLTQIHYTGYDSSWDEWVPAGRIRPAGTVSAPPQLPMTTG
jgi:RNA binding activity-knot of a chromodomain